MKYLKKKSFLITALIFFTACLISGGLVYLNIKKENQSALAAICGDNNVAGFAWSDNIGWVSFNSADCDKNNNGSVDKNEIPTVDASPNDVGKSTSVAIGSDDLPIIAYYDNTNGDLKFVKCGNLNCTWNNKMSVLDGSGGIDVGYSPAITIDQDGNPLIAYHRKNPAEIRFIKCTSLDCSSYNPPIEIASGGGFLTQARWFALNNSNIPSFAYLSFANDDLNLRYIQCQDNNCSGVNPYILLKTGSGDGLYNEGGNATLAIGSDNFPAILNTTSQSGPFRMTFVKCSQADCSTFTSQYVDNYTTNPLVIAMTLDASNKPMMAYLKDNGVQYIKCDDSSCSSFSSPKTISSTINIVGHINIFKDSQGNPLITFYVGGADSIKGLHFIKCNDEYCNSRNEIRVDYGGIVGKFSSIAMGSDGLPIISYYDETNGNLKVAKCLNADCTSVFKDGCGGNDDATTPVIPYGVKIDWPTGNFSGYAWSSNIGWVSFNEIGAPDYSFNTNCPSACDIFNNCTACYNSSNSNVYGWAKALSLGDDGWIKLSDASWSNGVTINGISKEFEGWAWNGNATAGTGIGWLSFSHLNCDTDGDGIREAGEGNSGCPAVGTAIADYKVYITNSSPTAIDLKAPNITYEQACSSRDARRVQLTWEFDDPDVAACGDYESAYQIIVDTVNYTTQTELEALVDNGRGDGWPYKTPKTSVPSPPTPVESFFPTNNTIHRNAALDYDTQYYWWVKVWDKYSADSGWVQYDSLTDTDNDDGNLLTFTTYKHEFPEFPQTPNPPFSWFPLEPSKEEKILFSAEGSKYYTVSDPSNPALCSDGVVCGYLWTVTPLGTADIDDNIAYSPNITFHEAKTSQPVTLKVTDAENYWCEASYDFFPLIKLPTWKEVKYR